jgi:phage gpG-like protein
MTSHAYTIELSGDALAVLPKIADRPGLARALARAMDQQNLSTVSHIQQARLSGVGPFPPAQGRLGVRSQLLRSSLRPSKAVISGDAIASAIGTPVKYAALHEFGGVVKRVLLAGSVRLRTDRQGNLLRQGKNGKLAVFAKRSHKLASTVAYSGGKRYDAVYPERAPIRRGIADKAADYSAKLSTTVIDFWAKESGGAN